MAAPRPIPVHCDTSFRAAARAAVEVRGSELLDYVGKLTAHQGPGGDDVVHDARVACRRFRACIEVFGDAFPDKSLRRARSKIKTLGQALGLTRDIDVLISCLSRDMAEFSRVERVAATGLLEELGESRLDAGTALRKCLAQGEISRARSILDLNRRR